MELHFLFRGFAQLVQHLFEFFAFPAAEVVEANTRGALIAAVGHCSLQLEREAADLKAQFDARMKRSGKRSSGSDCAGVETQSRDESFRMGSLVQEANEGRPFVLDCEEWAGFSGAVHGLRSLLGDGNRGLAGAGRDSRIIGGRARVLLGDGLGNKNGLGSLIESGFAKRLLHGFCCVFVHQTSNETGELILRVRGRKGKADTEIAIMGPLGDASDAQDQPESEEDNFNLGQRARSEGGLHAGSATANADIDELAGNHGSLEDQMTEGVVKGVALVDALYAWPEAQGR